MVPGLTLQSSRWSPSTPVSRATVDFDDTQDSARDTDLIIRSDGAIHAVTGTCADSALPVGLTELTIPFDDGSARTVLVLTDPDGAHTDASEADPRTWIDRIAHARSLDDDALIIVRHPFPRGAGAVQGQSPQRRLDMFDHHAVRAGGDLLLSTHTTDTPQVDIVRERVSITGGVAAVELSPTGSRVRVRVPGGRADAEQLTMTMLRATATPDALLHAMDLADDGSILIDLDRHHRPPVLTVNQGIGTAVTVWEDEPVDLQFDRSIPARMYMWERELKRRGATVHTIGTRVLFGHGPTGRNYLVHVTETNRTGIPGSTATGNKKTARHLLQRAGVRIAEGAYFSLSTPVDEALPLLDAHEALVIKPVDGYAGRGVTVGVTTPEEFRAAWQVAAKATSTGIVVEEQFVGEDVRISVVDGVARAANKRVPPQITGDGVSTVRDLIIAKNRDRYDNLHLHAKPIVLTLHRLARLAAAGLTPFSVLPADETHVIDHKANLATGGEPADVTDEIHPSYLRIAERAATAFPAVSIAGVDLLAADPTQPADDDSHIIVEVNSYPDIASHGTAFTGTPRNVVAHAADLVLSAPPALEHVRRQSAPEPVPEPTSAALLAAEMRARGFSIDWLTPRMFIAEGHGATLGFCEAMTDQTSHAARMVLRRPLLRRRILDEAGLPQPKAQVFGHRSSGRAWTYAKRLGDATVQFGGNPPIDMHGMDRRAFDALWSDNAATIRSHNAAIAARATGTRFDVLVVHGRVLSSVRLNRAGDFAGRVDLHRSYRRLAADAARAVAGADIVCVSLTIEDPLRPARPTTVVVSNVSINPDLVSFVEVDGGRARLIERLIDLHLGSARPAPEKPDAWHADADRFSARAVSAARRAQRRLRGAVEARLPQRASASTTVRGGLVFEVGQSSARVIGHEAGITDLTVPDQVDGLPVTAIAAGSLREATGLRSVIVPSSVTTLGADAFAGCTDLEHVELPPTLRTINARAFEGCSSLHTVVLPTDLQRIAQRAFAGCTSLTTLQHFVSTGPAKTREIRRGLVERSIPQVTEHIGVGAFDGCTSLTHIAIPHRVTDIRTDTFAGCTSLQSVWLHSGVTAIHARSFSGCSSLERLHVPNDLTTMSADSFAPSTSVVCADGSAAHARAVELGLTVAPYQPRAEHVVSALDAEGTPGDRMIGDVVEDQDAIDALAQVYELRPAMPAQPRRAEDRDRHIREPRFRRQNGTYQSVSDETGSDVTITMVGDLMCGAIQQRSALRNGEFDFTQSLTHVSDIFGSADLALGNLETMVAQSFPLSSDALYVDGRPHLNAPFSYLETVRGAGIDAVFSAQNHLYDTGTRGILETLDALNDSQLIHGGLYASPDEPRYVLFSINGMTIGVVAHLDPVRQKMKKSSFTDEGLDALTSLLRPELVHRDIAAARAAGAEFIVAYCHWGGEYTEKISARQSRFAQMVADAGADYIFGSHSHCPQPYTRLTSASGREVPVVYSGGNFVSYINRHHPITLDTFIGSLTLTRDATGAVVMKEDGYIPCRIVADRGIRGRVSVATLDDLDAGLLGYDPDVARSDRARIAAVLGEDYRSLPRSVFG